jgi:hypothetical protein
VLTLIRLAADAAPIASVQTYLLTQGVLGVATLVLGLAFWRAWSRECARADRAEKALADKNEQLQQMQMQVIPVLVKSTEQMEHTLPVLAEASAALAAARSRRS